LTVLRVHVHDATYNGSNDVVPVWHRVVLAIVASSQIMSPCLESFQAGDLVSWGRSVTVRRRHLPLRADAGHRAGSLRRSRNLDVIQEHFHGDLT
jgi:hypothetical protein